jgi:hypothetical protein
MLSIPGGHAEPDLQDERADAQKMVDDVVMTSSVLDMIAEPTSLDKAVKVELNYLRGLWCVALQHHSLLEKCSDVTATGDQVKAEWDNLEGALEYIDSQRWRVLESEADSQHLHHVSTFAERFKPVLAEAQKNKSEQASLKVHEAKTKLDGSVVALRSIAGGMKDGGKWKQDEDMSSWEAVLEVSGRTLFSKANKGTREAADLGQGDGDRELERVQDRGRRLRCAVPDSSHRAGVQG